MARKRKPLKVFVGRMVTDADLDLFEDDHDDYASDLLGWPLAVARSKAACTEKLWGWFLDEVRKGLEENGFTEIGVVGIGRTSGDADNRIGVTAEWTDEDGERQTDEIWATISIEEEEVLD